MSSILLKKMADYIQSGQHIEYESALEMSSQAYINSFKDDDTLFKFRNKSDIPSPIYWAVQCQQLKIVRCLVDRNAQLDLKSKNPVILAIDKAIAANKSNTSGGGTSERSIAMDILKTLLLKDSPSIINFSDVEFVPGERTRGSPFLAAVYPKISKWSSYLSILVLLFLFLLVIRTIV